MSQSSPLSNMLLVQHLYLSGISFKNNEYQKLCDTIRKKDEELYNLLLTNCDTNQTSHTKIMRDASDYMFIDFKILRKCIKKIGNFSSKLDVEVMLCGSAKKINLFFDALSQEEIVVMKRIIAIHKL